jgi:tripartite-type tricarboxylate transporter receptor subunit TctC
MRRIAMTLTLGVLIAACALPTARAADYPNRPIRMVVPYPAGGVLDSSARIIGRKLGEYLGQQIVIDNRPGASGTLGDAVVARAEPDGYTLLLTSGDFIIMPSLVPAMSFDPYKDLAPIALVGSTPMLVVANINAPFYNVKELIAAAKAAPGSIGYSSPGVGTINNVAGEWLAHAAGIKLLHVPYRGGAPAANGVAAGDVPLGFFSPSSALSLLAAKRVKVIGLTGKRRPEYAPPSWPTLAESGIDIDSVLWNGVFAPAGTPAAILDRLGKELTRAVHDPEIREALNKAGIDAESIVQPAFGERIRSDAARYKDIIEKTGIKISR